MRNVIRQHSSASFRRLRRDGQIRTCHLIHTALLLNLSTLDLVIELRNVFDDHLRKIKSGRYVTVAGIVTHRQRPGTASGVVFAKLEDEAGTTNLIIWSKIFDAQREAVLGPQLMLVRGQLQSEQGVIHVVTRKARDYTGGGLGELSTTSRDFR